MLITILIVYAILGLETTIYLNVTEPFDWRHARGEIAFNILCDIVLWPILVISALRDLLRGTDL